MHIYNQVIINFDVYLTAILKGIRLYFYSIYLNINILCILCQYYNKFTLKTQQIYLENKKKK